MSDKRLSGSIALTKLQSAVITTKKGNKAILIPIDANYLIEKDGAIYLNVGVVVRDEQDQYGQNGFISHQLGSDKYKELGKEKAQELKLPILGNIKDFSGSNDSEGATNIEGQIDPELDPLPF